ncbi:3H domain-containing protein, partial [Bacillus cereus group sp. Bce025]
QKIENTNASYLSQLTDGIHLHTIEADSKEKLDAACEALDKAGFLVY